MSKQAADAEDQCIKWFNYHLGFSQDAAVGVCGSCFALNVVISGSLDLSLNWCFLPPKVYAFCTGIRPG